MSTAKAGLLALALTSVNLAGCVAHGPPEDETAPAPVIGAAVAASVQYAFTGLAADFTRQTGIAVSTTYGSSGKLAAQIGSGAPFDVFFAADMEYPASLYESGHAAAEPRVYALGTLAIWTTKDLDLAPWPHLLSSAAVRRIAIANPRTAPFGREALQALDRAGVSLATRGKLVYGESVAQANQFVFSGAADVGLAATASLHAPGLLGAARFVELDPGAFGTIPQGAVLLHRGSETQAEAARRLLDFVLGPDGRATLARYGYRLP